MSNDDAIDDYVRRIDRIIERLESEDVTLAEAKEIFEEGQHRLERLTDALDVGSGDVGLLED